MPDFFEEIIKRDSTTQIVGGGGASPTGTYFTIDNNLSEGAPSTMRTNLGLVIGTDVQAYSSELDTYVANPLTAGELGQLQNINTVTISNTQWGYVGEMNQSVRTNANVVFNKVESEGDVVAYRSGSGTSITDQSYTADSLTANQFKFSGGATTQDVFVYLDGSWQINPDYIPETGGGGETYTAGQGIALVGNEFSVNAGDGLSHIAGGLEVNQAAHYTWTGSHEFTQALKISKSNFGFLELDRSSGDFGSWLLSPSNDFTSFSSKDAIRFRYNGSDRVAMTSDGDITTNGYINGSRFYQSGTRRDAQWNTAYNHSQIESGNPHKLSPSDVGAVGHYYQRTIDIDNIYDNVIDVHSGNWSFTGSDVTGSNATGLLNLHTHNGDYNSQLLFNTSANELYTRSRHNGSWTTWRRLYHTGNKPSASDVGAVSSGGGTFGGNVTFDGGDIFFNRGRITGDFTNLVFDLINGAERFRFRNNNGNDIVEFRDNRKSLFWDDIAINGDNGKRIYMRGDNFGTSWYIGHDPDSSIGRRTYINVFDGSGQGFGVKNSSNVWIFQVEGSTGDAEFSGELSYTDANFTGSDRRWKTDIRDIDNGLKEVNKLKTYTFLKRGKHRSGFISQEIREHLPHLVKERDDGYLMLHENGIIPYNTRAIQELDTMKADKTEVERLRDRVHELETEVETLRRAS